MVCGGLGFRATSIGFTRADLKRAVRHAARTAAVGSPSVDNAAAAFLPRRLAPSSASLACSTPLAGGGLLTICQPSFVNFFTQMVKIYKRADSTEITVL
jgi:hypothetical protein